MNDTRGEYATETVWDDTDVAKLDTIADTQFHRNVDTLIIAADKEGESCICAIYIAQACLLQRLYLPTITRVREGVLRHPFNNLWYCFRKTGGFGCSEHTFDSNSFGSFC